MHTLEQVTILLLDAFEKRAGCDQEVVGGGELLAPTEVTEPEHKRAAPVLD